jgi:predicted NAD/FAD-dependent oxidoreductase
MGSIPESMVDRNKFEVRRDIWVPPSSGVRWMKGKKQWKVQAKGRVLGEYDCLVIAHSGKCADRLMSKTPAKRLHNLLRVNFAPEVAAATGGKRMTLSSIYSLTFAVDGASELAGALPEPFVAGYVQGHPALRFLTCQTRKYETTGGREVWTLLSSAQFAKKHKAPQEFLADGTVEGVSGLLLAALEEAALGRTGAAGRLQSAVLDKRLQLWGAAVPVNVWDGPGFLYDAEHSVGCCGDWLVEPSIAGAWTSGRLLADYVLDSGSDKGSAGIEGGSFRRSESAQKVGIGAV